MVRGAAGVPSNSPGEGPAHLLEDNCHDATYAGERSYWLLPEGRAGSVVISFGCPQTISTVLLKNVPANGTAVGWGQKNEARRRLLELLLPPSSGTKDFRLEVSADGREFSLALAGSLDPVASPLCPAPGAAFRLGGRAALMVRVTLVSSHGPHAGLQFVGFTGPVYSCAFFYQLVSRLKKKSATPQNRS